MNSPSVYNTLSYNFQKENLVVYRTLAINQKMPNQWAQSQLVCFYENSSAIDVTWTLAR